MHCSPTRPVAASVGAVLTTLALGLGSTVVSITPAAALPTLPKLCATWIDTATIAMSPRPVVVHAHGLTRQTITYRLHDTCADATAISAVVSYSDGNVDYFESDGGHVAPLGDGEFQVTDRAYFGADDLDNADVTLWSPLIQVYGSGPDQADGPEFRVQRAAQVTTNAGPEPVVKNHTLTIKGQLDRADLDTATVHGYTKQPVALQFRSPKGSYATVASVVSDAHGGLSTKRKATKDGCYRYLFSGTKTTAPAISVGDCVDVK